MTISLSLGSGTFMISPICLVSVLVRPRLILLRPSAMGDNTTDCARLWDNLAWGEWGGLRFSLANLRTWWAHWSRRRHGIYSVNIYGSDANALAVMILVLKICLVCNRIFDWILVFVVQNESRGKKLVYEFRSWFLNVNLATPPDIVNTRVSRCWKHLCSVGMSHDFRLINKSARVQRR